MSEGTIPQTAAILAGGLGTRLRPLTCRLPKSLVPVANRPVVAYTLELLRKHGVRRVVFLLMYRADAMRSALARYRHDDLEIEFLAADEDYGTAGSVRRAMSLLGEEFFVLAGDILTDVNLTSLYRLHTERGAVATIAVTGVDNPTAYGLVLSGEDGRVRGFLEKPTWGQVVTNQINAGVYVLRSEALRSYAEGRTLSFEHEVFPDLIAGGVPVLAFEHEGYWRDLGSLDDYHQANRDVLTGQFSPDFAPSPDESSSATIHPEAEVGSPSVIGAGAWIGARARVEQSVIGPGCKVGEDVTILDSVLWAGVEVGPGSRLCGCVVGTNSRLGSRVFVPDKVVIAENTQVGDNVRFHEGVKIWPGKSIEDGAIVTSSLVGAERWGRELFEGARITGLLNQELTPEFGARLGAALGSTFAQGEYVISSRDVSPGARMMNRALICGLMSVGVNVEDLRVTPIPIVRYALRTGREVSGFYVRQSPFDAKLLDILFFDRDGRDLALGKVKAVERMFFREDFARAEPTKVGRLDFPIRVTEAYIEDFLEHLDLDALRSSRLKIVIDYSYGAASFALPQILGALRCDVVSLNAYADPGRLARTKEDFAAALVQLSSIVTGVGADVGFLIDAGAEKIFLVDEKGRFIDSDRLLVLTTHLVLRQMDVRRIAVPVTASSQIESMAAEHGVEVLRTPDDSRALVEACLSEQAGFAGDGLGGFIFSDFLFSFDAMFSLAKILELMARTGLRFGDLDREIPLRPLVKLQVPCPKTSKGKLMRNLLERTSDLPRDLTDGVQLLLDGARVLLLPDRSEPVFHICAEAEDPLRAAELARQYREVVRKLLAS